jgi:hypothetical protein
MLFVPLSNKMMRTHRRRTTFDQVLDFTREVSSNSVYLLPRGRTTWACRTGECSDMDSVEWDFTGSSVSSGWMKKTITDSGVCERVGMAYSGISKGWFLE